jgi:hypothetical protein
MTFGLMLPKMCIEYFYPGFAKLNPRGSTEGIRPRKV